MPPPAEHTKLASPPSTTSARDIPSLPVLSHRRTSRPIARQPGFWPATTSPPVRR
jgi:hypothetical protein